MEKGNLLPHFPLSLVLWTLLLFTIPVERSEACVVVEKDTNFDDFALRSNVVLEATLTRNVAASKPRFSALFRVTHVFSEKTGGLKNGDLITSGQFGASPTCVKPKFGKKYIMFLEKPKVPQAPVGVRRFVNRYNIVGSSERNLRFFASVLNGSYSGETILRSGCRQLPKPDHGKITCSQNKVRCIVNCDDGYSLEKGIKLKSCQATTGLWYPFKPISCVAKTNASTTTAADLSTTPASSNTTITVTPTMKLSTIIKLKAVSPKKPTSPKKPWTAKKTQAKKLGAGKKRLPGKRPLGKRKKGSKKPVGKRPVRGKKATRKRPVGGKKTAKKRPVRGKKPVGKKKPRGKRPTGKGPKAGKRPTGTKKKPTGKGKHKGAKKRKTSAKKPAGKKPGAFKAKPAVPRKKNPNLKGAAAQKALAMKLKNKKLAATTTPVTKVSGKPTAATVKQSLKDITGSPTPPSLLSVNISVDSISKKTSILPTSTFEPLVTMINRRATTEQTPPPRIPKPSTKLTAKPSMTSLFTKKPVVTSKSTPTKPVRKTKKPVVPTVPIETTKKPVAITKPTPATKHIVTAKPVKTTKSTILTTKPAKKPFATTKPVKPTRKTVLTTPTKKPVVSTVPIKTTKKPVGTTKPTPAIEHIVTAKPVKTTKKTIFTTKKPIATSKPVKLTRKTATPTKKPVVSPAPIKTTTKKPVATTKQTPITQHVVTTKPVKTTKKATFTTKPTNKLATVVTNAPTKITRKTVPTTEGAKITKPIRGTTKTLAPTRPSAKKPVTPKPGPRKPVSPKKPGKPGKKTVPPGKVPAKKPTAGKTPGPAIKKPAGRRPAGQRKKPKPAAKGPVKKPKPGPKGLVRKPKPAAKGPVKKPKPGLKGPVKKPKPAAKGRTKKPKKNQSKPRPTRRPSGQRKTTTTTTTRKKTPKPTTKTTPKPTTISKPTTIEATKTTVLTTRKTTTTKPTTTTPKTRPVMPTYRSLQPITRRAAFPSRRPMTSLRPTPRYSRLNQPLPTGRSMIRSTVHTRPPLPVYRPLAPLTNRAIYPGPRINLDQNNVAILKKVPSAPVLGEELEQIDDKFAVAQDGDKWTTDDGLSYEPELAVNKTVYGCPKYETSLTVFSVWQGGFNAMVNFSRLNVSINTGWMVRIQFEEPIVNIEGHVVNFFVGTDDRKTVCFTPKPYMAILYENQDLTVAFVARTDPEVTYIPRAKAYLLGRCIDDELGGKVVGNMFQGHKVVETFDEDAKAKEVPSAPTTAPPVTTKKPVVGGGTGTGHRGTGHGGTGHKGTGSGRPGEQTPPPRVAGATRKPWVRPKAVGTKRNTGNKAGQGKRLGNKPVGRNRASGTNQRRPTGTNPQRNTNKNNKNTNKRKPGAIRSAKPRSVFTAKSPQEIWPFNRCFAESINGVLPVGGLTRPDWTKTSNKKSGYDYNEVLHKSGLFYQAQKSGKLPKIFPIPWRGDSALKDGCSAGEMLHGGMYSGAGHEKSTMAIAFTTTMLAWGGIDYKAAYIASGEYKNLVKLVKSSAKYLIRCHTDDAELVVQVGKYQSSENTWSRPEEIDEKGRVIYKIDSENPGQDVAAETAAALAATAVMFKTSEPDFSKECLLHAKQLYTFARKYPGKYSLSLPKSVNKYYTTSSTLDDLIWALLWIGKATGSSSYLNMAEIMLKKLPSGSGSYFNWADKTSALPILLAKFAKSPSYKYTAKRVIRSIIVNATRTPNKQVWLSNTGTNMHTANSAFLALQTASLFKGSSFSNVAASFAEEQIHLLLGDSGRSFVVGFGEKYPKRPHHMASSCFDPPTKCDNSRLRISADSPHTLYGALVGGPDKDGKYQDFLTDEVHNEVAIDFNAGFQSAVAGLREMQLPGKSMITSSPNTLSRVGQPIRKSSLG